MFPCGLRVSILHVTVTQELLDNPVSRHLIFEQNRLSFYAMV